MNVQTLSRSKGHNAVAAIAYRRGVKLKDESTQQTFDYSKKKEVIFSEIVIPENAPLWMLEIAELQKTDPRLAAEMLWTSVEQKENRKDSQLAREIKMALPVELTEEQSIALTKEYVQKFCKLGMVVDFSIHWDECNPHVHILLSMRSLKQDGWGEKERGWNSKEFTLMAREHLAEVINKHLSLWGFENSVSHLSYIEQGIDQEPTIHIGSGRNRTTQYARTRNQEVRLRNLQKITDNPEILLDKLAKQKSSFSLIDIARTLGTQLTPANQEVLRPDPEPPKKRSFGSQLSSFMAAVSPKFLQPGFQTEPVVSAQSQIKELSSPVIEIPPEATVEEVIARVLEEIARNEAVFTEQHLARVLSRYVQNPEQVALALLQIKASSELLSIGPGEDGRERYTTRDIFEIENELQDLAEQLNHKASHQIGGRLINKTIKEFNLKDDQARAIRYLLKGSDLSIMVGRAGTGKSYSLKAARAAWEACDYRVLGVALAGIAAQGLEQDSGISSRTIESFCLALKQETLKLSSRDIIVMDEAGMTDSVSMSKVMTAVSQAGAKLVLVGDHAQLQPVGPGAIFRALLERVGFAELTTIRRQREVWQREATAQFAAGNTEKALGYYELHGCIYLEKTAALAASLLIKDWGSSNRESALEKNLILAYENVDVTYLNQQARQLLISEGKLSQGHLVKNNQGMLEIAVGERILFLENHWRYNIKNGQRATVKHLDLDYKQQVKAIHLELDGKDKKTIIIDPDKYKAFAHGYACTVHRAQGITVENTFVYVSGRWNKNLSYVAMSRHQGKVGIYAHNEAFKTIHELKNSLSKGALKDSVLDYPLAFAERRGLFIGGPGTSDFKHHLVAKLQWMVQSLKSNFEQTFFPKEHWERKAKEALKQQELFETLERRENAKLVASYVDANRAVGVAWEALNEKQAALGMTNDTPFKEREERLRGDGCLNRLREASVARDALSTEIYRDFGKYTKALELYDIKREKLEKQNEAHLIRARVAEYIGEVEQGRVVHRDKLAFKIQEALKQHYGALVNSEASLADLKKHSTNHGRRTLFRSYSEVERENFRKFETYVKLCQKTASLWKQIIMQEKSLKVSALVSVDDLTLHQLARLQVLCKTGTPLQRSLLIEAQTLNQQRNSVAAEIVKNIEEYKPGLDFYEFGDLRKKAENPSEFELKSQVIARERLEKLYQQAETHKKAWEKQQTIETYSELLMQQDETRFRMADKIIKDKKAYYGVIFENTTKPLELLRDLHRDARLYKREKLMQDLSPQQREAFMKVEQYMIERNAVGKIWGERKTSAFPDHPSIKEISNKHAILKDELGAAILAEPETYKEAVAFFNVKIESLNQSAHYHKIKADFGEFKRCPGDLRARMALAKRILSSRAAYFIIKDINSVGAEQLRRYANYATKLERIASLTPQERLLYEVALILPYFYRHTFTTIFCRFSNTIGAT